MKTIKGFAPWIMTMIAIATMFISLGRASQVEAQLEGVSNANGIHLSQSTFGTATPQFEISNGGSNQSVVIRDSGGTPEVYIDADGGMTVNDLTVASQAASGDLDMQNNIISNIGVAGTDFGSDGSLTTAASITATAGGVNVVDGGLTVTAGGATVTAGGVTVDGGGLAVNAGLATFAGGINCTPQTEAVAADFVITPTSCILSLTSSVEVTSSATTGIITTTATSGDIVILSNNNASDAINIDGTGGTIECKANVALGASDTLTLWYNGVDEVWNCLAGYDNS